MGVIKRQAIGYSVVNYLGVAIGSLSTIFLYPYDKPAYGLFRFLLDTANIIQPFAMLGAWYVGSRMFPIFKNEAQKNNGLFGLLSLLFVVGAILMSIVFFTFQPVIFPTSGLKDAFIIEKYINYIIPLFIVFGYFVLLKTYTSNLLKVILPSVLEQMIKIIFPLIFIFYLCRWITLEGLVWGILIHFTIIAFVSVWYLNRLGGLSFALPQKDFLTRQQWFDFAKYAAYGAIGNGSIMLALRIDSYMITMLMGDFEDTGRFAIASLIGSNIAVPYTAIAVIAGPIIAKAWNDNNIVEIKQIYQKSSENLLLIGLYLFGGVVLCIHDLFAIMPNQGNVSAEILVVYIVGLKSVVDMGTGINDAIISYSKHYIFNLIAIIGMAVINIFGNLYFIPRYGIAGAALATLISTIIFNTVKIIFIKSKFDLIPYTFNSVKTLLISIVSFAMVYYFPNFGHPLLNILIKGGIFTTLFVGMAVYFDASPDLTKLKQQAFAKIKR